MNANENLHNVIILCKWLARRRRVKNKIFEQKKKMKTIDDCMGNE